MPNRARISLLGLVLALFLTLALLPAPPILADDAVRIDSPTNGASVVGTIEVRGRAVTAAGSTFSFYRLHYGAGSSPSSLRPVGSPGDQPVEDGVLGIWDTAPLFSGEYTLQLTVYDTGGGTVTTHVVVNVLPAPTPTPRGQPGVLIPVVNETPTATEGDAGPPPTPLPELPQLVPNIPNIIVPPSDYVPPPIQPVDPGITNPGFQPIQIDPGAPAPRPQQVQPGQPASGALPTMDASQPLPPLAPFNPVNPVGPPGAPVVAPYEPPPTFALPPTPTQFGLPP
jgi:hypothetical protein